MEKGEGIKGREEKEKGGWEKGESDTGREEREKGGWEKGESDTLPTLQTRPNMA